MANEATASPSVVALSETYRLTARPSMYKYLDFDGTGTLVDVLRAEGDAALVRYIKSDDFASNMYIESGVLVGREVDVPDYSPFALKKHNRLLRAELLKKIQNRPTVRRSVFWREDRRGHSFETPLLIACCLIPSRDSSPEDEKREGTSGDASARSLFTRLARCLIETYPQLVNDVYLGKEYFGESCIHFAIVNSNLDFLRFLVEKGSRLDHRACGTFFLPDDQRELHRLDQHCTQETDYRGDTYYGEYPLAFAASLGNQDIYAYLISKGANPNVQDSFGNTALHLMVIHKQKDMCVYAMTGFPSSVMPHDLANYYNRTPLMVAASIGTKELFELLVDIKKERHWTFGKTECTSHDLTGIDSIDPLSGQTDSQSAISITLKGDTQGHLEMLETSLIARLLDQKWHTFAKRMFMISLFRLALYLTFLSVSIYTRRDGDLRSIKSSKDIARVFFECLTVVFAASYIAYDVIRELVKGPRLAIQSWLNAPAKLFFLLCCCLMILTVIGRFVGHRSLEDVTLAIIAVGSWLCLLFYCRGSRTVGPFVTMIYDMIRLDIARFCFIYLIFLISFSQALHFLLKDSEDELFGTPYDSMMASFLMTLGSFEYETLNNGRLAILSQFLFIIFMVLTAILLLNMLIAMMTTTYQNIAVRASMEWKRQWAKIVMVLESSLSDKQRLKYQKMYTIDLNDLTDNPGTSRQRIPALMVTKERVVGSDIRHETARMNWKRTGSLNKRIGALRVLTQQESSQLTKQAVGTTSRKLRGVLEVWKEEPAERNVRGRSWASHGTI
ncbi:transient receptor potential cation channel subfamily V member 6-like [Oscarella lobularis]|uniref:transient receptor potential cation channel subfamily V member 6-like n=1 Tax=Oscarella lobularis TaxID=121494 RepID=UPI003314249A